MAGDKDRNWVGGHSSTYGPRRTACKLGNCLIALGLPRHYRADRRPDALPIGCAGRSERQGHRPDLSIEVGIQPGFSAEQQRRRVLVTAPAPVNRYDSIRFCGYGDRACRSVKRKLRQDEARSVKPHASPRAPACQAETGDEGALRPQLRPVHRSGLRPRRGTPMDGRGHLLQSMVIDCGDALSPEQIGRTEWKT